MGQNHKNEFVAYLNSLHNIAANGANALAESQALNRYFSEIYEPFPLVYKVFEILTDGCERVVVLTGHAGDGKSTVALDVLKRLRRLPAHEPIHEALSEREIISHPSGNIYIIKDMSELTGQQRLEWLNQGFNLPGSWLIVSNTGPLLNSLDEFVRQSNNPRDIESDVLNRLGQAYNEGDLSSHTLSGFPKELVVLNMTRLDNVTLGARILTRMVNHTAWNQCRGCEVESVCPLQQNRQALLKIGLVAEERVRWIYQRLSAYEQRLTLRQMVAHLALSLTGGMSCSDAMVLVNTENERSLDRVIFSESFFGYRECKPWPDAEGLRVVVLLRRLTFGGPIAVDFEHELLNKDGLGRAEIPEGLFGVQQHWRKLGCESSGVRWRFALRRMVYIFGRASATDENNFNVFLDNFLKSPRLRDFDLWQSKGQLILDSWKHRTLIKSCLQVLLEVYSGFSAGQYQAQQQRLFLTLRRPDRAVVQPTQLVVAEFDYRDFAIDYDAAHRLPLLSFRGGDVKLMLTLPLLDYIHARSTGSLSHGLVPVHLAQLEWFRAELLQQAAKTNRNRTSVNIGLLRAGIDGEVKLHRYLFDQTNQVLERD